MPRLQLHWGLRVLVVLVAVAIVLVASRDRTQAIFHLAAISEVMVGVNGDPDQQYVEVRMDFPGQHIVHDTLVTFFDEDVVPVHNVLLILPNDVPNDGRDVRWLMASEAFAQATGLTPDFIIPPDLFGERGLVCWGAPDYAPPPNEWPGDDSETPEEEGWALPFFYTDCVAYGGYQGRPPVASCEPDTGLAAVGGSNRFHGFPRWYQDCNSVVLGPCLAQNDLCDTNEPEPAEPISFPDNFPSEFVYWEAEAEIDVPPLLAFAQFTLAGEFGGAIADGNQITTASLSIFVEGLTPGETYTVTHPFGSEDLVADGSGAVFIFDSQGCFSLPCDFSAVFGTDAAPFLVWDSGAPSGFVGDPSVPHTVTGSPTGNNFLRIQGPGIDMQTDLFSVSGQRYTAPLPTHPPATGLPAGDGQKALQRLQPPPVTQYNHPTEAYELYCSPGMSAQEVEGSDAKSFSLCCPTPENNAGEMLLLGADSDGDGLPDCHEAEIGTVNGERDTDQDGCLDGAEVANLPAAGGRRDPREFWDFFDTPDASNVRDGAVNGPDVFRVAARFGTSGSATSVEDALSPAAPAGYHAAFDRRAAPGLLSGPADGTISSTDIFLVVGQFGTTCSG